MRKPSVNWEKIRQECVDFDLSEYRPDMRQEPGFYDWNKEGLRSPLQEADGEIFSERWDP